MNINYEYYKIFYYVCETGSFTKAAKTLNNSQPNITRAMNNLEDQLGIILFVRSKKGIVLTGEGEKLYQRVKRACEQLIAGEKELDDMKQLKSGNVTIGVTEIALHEILLPVLKEFRKKYPEIIVKIINETSSIALKCLEEDTVDFALVTTPIQQTELYHYDMIHEFKEYAVILKEEVHSQIKILKDINQYPLIMLPKGTGTNAFYQALFNAHDIPFEPQMYASTANQVLSMVKAGLGVGFVPESMITDETLYTIKLDDSFSKRNICLVTKNNQLVNIAAQQLIEEIKSI